MEAPRRDESVEPSAWIRSISAAPRRLQYCGPGDVPAASVAEGRARARHRHAVSPLEEQAACPLGDLQHDFGLARGAAAVLDLVDARARADRLALPTHRRRRPVPRVEADQRGRYSLDEHVSNVARTGKSVASWPLMGSNGVRVFALCSLAALVVAVPAWSAPKPDPPPVPPPAPAPAPAPQPPPPVFQPPPPADPTVVAPSGPTAAELAARRRAALRQRAARLAATKRAQERKQTAVAPQVQTGESERAAFSDPQSGTSQALPFLLAGFLAGALLLVVALTPARAVPWSRVSRALDDRRQELALLGALGFVATGFFFLLAMMSSA